MTQEEKQLLANFKEMATMIIMGLLREEGWELPETNDEEITTRRLERKLYDAIHEKRETTLWEAEVALRVWLESHKNADPLVRSGFYQAMDLIKELHKRPTT